MKIIAKSLKLIPSQIGNKGVFFFSKKLKHKIMQDLKNDPTLVKTPESTRPFPNIAELTLAESLKMGTLIQFAPPLMMIFNCLIISDELFTNNFDFYKWNLFGMQKFTSLLVLTNINYPSNQYIKYAIMGAVLGTNLIPIFSIYSPITQIIQFLLILNHDSKKMKENTELMPEEQALMTERLKVKLLLYFILTGALVFKALYHYKCFQMNKKIEELNMINRGEVPSTLIPSPSTS